MGTDLTKASVTASFGGSQWDRLKARVATTEAVTIV
jgi:hypothetical protein